MTKKLIIDNQTAWSTKALRSVFLKVLNENIKFEGPLKNTIRPVIVYGRRHAYSGYAYLNTGRMRLRLPKPSGECRWCDDGLTWHVIEDGKRWSVNPKFVENAVSEKCEHCAGSGKSETGLQLDVYKLAHLFEHELAHCRGYHHKGMCQLNSWNNADEKNYPYLNGMSVGIRPEKPKPIVDQAALRYQRVLQGIERWQAKRKRADNALKKLNRQRAYYERKKEKAAP